EPVEGTGRFYTRDAPDGATGALMGFELEAHATGSAAPMINALLKKFVGEQSGPFLDALRAAIVAEAARPAEGGAEQTATATATVTPGRGMVVVEYDAPRTDEVERWVTERYHPALRAQAAVRRVQRLELTRRGAEARFLEILDSSDAPATVATLRT